jgi:hypothetical protein
LLLPLNTNPGLTYFPDEFNAIGKGGLFSLYSSLSSFHTYAARMSQLFVNEAFMTALDITGLAIDMKLDGESNDPLDIYAIFGGAMSMAHIGTTANPPTSGVLSFLSGFAGVLGAINKPCVSPGCPQHPSDSVFENC